MAAQVPTTAPAAARTAPSPRSSRRTAPRRKPSANSRPTSAARQVDIGPGRGAVLVPEVLVGPGDAPGVVGVERLVPLVDARLVGDARELGRQVGVGRVPPQVEETGQAKGGSLPGFLPVLRL